MHYNLDTKFLLHEEARQKLLSGASTVASVVAPTLGPKGHFVVLGGERPIITNDGATIASHLKLDDEFESIGAEVVKNVAKSVATVVGDGTTTATLLTAEILRLGLESGIHANDLSKELSQAALEIVGKLQESSRPATREEVIEVGKRACKDEQLGTAIAELIYQVGSDSHVFIETGTHTKGEAVQGSVFASKYLANRGDVPLPIEPLKDIPVLCLDHLFTDFQRVVPLVEEMIEHGQKQMIVLCEGLDGEALRATVSNHSRGSFTMYPVKVENVKEAAIVFGARLFFAYDHGNPSRKELGQAGKVFLAPDRMIVVDPQGSTEKAIESLKGEGLPTEIVTRRKAQLSGHIGILTLSSFGDTELDDKKIRSDDGIRACQAAIKGGVVEGGGSAFITASEDCSSEMMKQAVSVIQKTINDNAGKKIPTNGVVDPTLVLITALVHSTTAACQLLSSEAVLL